MTGARTVALSNRVENFPADGLDIVIVIGAELCSSYVLFPATSRPSSERARAPRSRAAPSCMAEAVGQTACKPGSVLDRSAASGPARDGHSSGTPVTGRLARPTRTAARKPACRMPFQGRASGVPSLLGLAPGGVCRAVPVAGNAVRSYRTLSPLPAFARGLRWAVCFLWHFPWGRPRRVLPGTVFPWSPDFPPRSRVKPRPERPSGRLAPPLRYLAPSRRQADRRRQSASRPARRPVVSPSARPSTRAGRKWR